MTPEVIRHGLTNHPVAPEAGNRMQAIAEAAIRVSDLIGQLAPDCYERDQAQLRLRESLMWARGAIACASPTGPVGEAVATVATVAAIRTLPFPSAPPDAPAPDPALGSLPAVYEAKVADLIDTAAAAAVLGVHASTIAAWARSGRLPHLGLGRTYRFHPDDLATFLRLNVSGAMASTGS